MVVPELGQLAVLAIAGLAAGYINAVAGAGSLLTLPALIFTGLDAPAANATNRIAVLFQNAAAIVALRRGGMRFGSGPALMAIPAAAGGVAGAVVATLMSDELLRGVIAAAMVIFLLVTLVSSKKLRRPDPQGREGDAPPPALEAPRAKWTLVPAFVVIGFYAGLLQAGVGVVILLYMAAHHGLSLVGSNATKIVVIFVLALVALGVFVALEQPIDLARGAALAAATTVGGYLGARDTLRRGERFVRVVLVVAVLGSAAKLAVDALS